MQPLPYILFVVLAQPMPPTDTLVLNAVACEYHLSGDAYRLLFAIRHAENGAAGRELGILTPAAMRYKGDLEAFAARYCPPGASNDPLGLNAYWLRNVRASWK